MIQLKEEAVDQPFLVGDAGGVDDDDGVVVGIEATQGELGARGDGGGVDLGEEAGPGRVNGDEAASEGTLIEDAREVYRIDKLRFVGKRVQADSAGDDIDRGDGGLDEDGDAALGRGFGDESNASLTKSWMAGNREDEASARLLLGKLDDAAGDLGVEIVEGERSFVEVVAV